MERELAGGLPVGEEPLIETFPPQGEIWGLEKTKNNNAQLHEQIKQCISGII